MYKEYFRHNDDIIVSDGKISRLVNCDNINDFLKSENMLEKMKNRQKKISKKLKILKRQRKTKLEILFPILISIGLPAICIGSSRIILYLFQIEFDNVLLMKIGIALTTLSFPVATTISYKLFKENKDIKNNIKGYESELSFLKQEYKEEKEKYEKLSKNIQKREIKVSKVDYKKDLLELRMQLFLCNHLSRNSKSIDLDKLPYEDRMYQKLNEKQRQKVLKFVRK